jgi:hypothetical protein
MKKNIYSGLELKLKGMFWDLPPEKREILIKQVIQNPLKAFQDENVLIRGLNSLSWYDLIQILGHTNLFSLLSESSISKLYPIQRRTFYKNAKELLSKYTLSLTG